MLCSGLKEKISCENDVFFGGCVCWCFRLFKVHLAGLSKAGTMFMFTELSEENWPSDRWFFFAPPEFWGRTGFLGGVALGGYN